MPPGAGEPDDPADESFMEDLGFDEGRDTAIADPRTWRLAALVAAVCVLTVGIAILLLQTGGSGKHNTDLALPTTTPSSSQIGPGPETLAASTSDLATSLPPRRPHTSPSTRHRVVHPTSTALTSQSTIVLPPPSTSLVKPPPITSSAAPSSTAASVVSISLAEGAHSFACHGCNALVVTLTNPTGAMAISCFAATDPQNPPSAPFAQYPATAPVTQGCAYGTHGATVWVEARDAFGRRYSSNSVVWR